jgi:hypothetical protein
MERGLHEPAPDLNGKVAAGHFLRRAAVVVPEPDAGNEVARVANEPGIAEILAGPRLSCRLEARDLGLAGRAGQQRLAHHPVHHGDGAGVDHAPEPALGPPVHGLAAGPPDLRDDVGHDAMSAVREGRIGAHEFERRHLRGAECDRRVRLEARGDPEPSRNLNHLLRADLHAEPHRDRVERQRKPIPKRDRPAIVARVIFRVPAFTEIGPSSRTVSGVRPASIAAR